MVSQIDQFILVRRYSQQAPEAWSTPEFLYHFVVEQELMLNHTLGDNLRQPVKIHEVHEKRVRADLMPYVANEDRLAADIAPQSAHDKAPSRAAVRQRLTQAVEESFT